MPVLLDDGRYRIEVLGESTLFVSLVGDVEDSDLDDVFGVFQPALVERAPAKVLIDASGLGDSSLSMRWQLAMRMKANRSYVDRTAVFGVPGSLEAALRIVLRASGRSNIRIFSSRAEAEDWLAADEPG
jgi:hypothetical protein